MMESIRRFANTVRDISRASVRFDELLENPSDNEVLTRHIKSMMGLLGELLQGIETPSIRIHLSRLQQFHFRVRTGISRFRDDDLKHGVRKAKTVIVDLSRDLDHELHRIARLQDKLLATEPVRYNPYIIIRNPGPPADDREWMMAARRITKPEYEEVENDMAGLAIQ